MHVEHINEDIAIKEFVCIIDKYYPTLDYSIIHIINEERISDNPKIKNILNTTKSLTWGNCSKKIASIII